MRVVHLSYYYGNNVSGAPVAATRLHQAMLEFGVDSHFICVDRREDGVNVYELPQNRVTRLVNYVVPRVFWILTKVWFGRMIMPNLLPLVGFEEKIREINPDVIHIHFIGQDMVSFAQLMRVKCKAVWTLHDLTLLNAIEPHPGHDERFVCGFDVSNSSAVERWMFARKRQLVESLRPTLIGPSRWVVQMARQSSLGERLPHYVIPNVLDPVYRYEPSLCVRTEKFTILFGAYGGRSARYKGWDHLVAALALLPPEVKVNSLVEVFGESAEEREEQGVLVRFLGSIREPERLKSIYHSADILALPSLLDNAPQVKFEALACGLPVVAFARTGCAEGIVHTGNGWIAEDGDIAAYAKGICHYFHRWKRGESDGLREVIARQAALVQQTRTIVEETLEAYR